MECGGKRATANATTPSDCGEFRRRSVGITVLFQQPILSGKDEHGSRESLVISHPQNRPKAVSRSLSLSCHTHSMGARKLHDCTGYFPLAQRTDSQTIES